MNKIYDLFKPLCPSAVVRSAKQTVFCRQYFTAGGGIKEVDEKSLKVEHDDGSLKKHPAHLNSNKQYNSNNCFERDGQSQSLTGVKKYRQTVLEDFWYQLNSNLKSTTPTVDAVGGDIERIGNESLGGHTTTNQKQLEMAIQLFEQKANTGSQSNFITQRGCSQDNAKGNLSLNFNFFGPWSKVITRNFSDFMVLKNFIQANIKRFYGSQKRDSTNAAPTKHKDGKEAEQNENGAESTDSITVDVKSKVSNLPVVYNKTADNSMEEEKNAPSIPDFIHEANREPDSSYERPDWISVVPDDFAESKSKQASTKRGETQNAPPQKRNKDKATVPSKRDSKLITLNSKGSSSKLISKADKKASQTVATNAKSHRIHGKLDQLEDNEQKLSFTTEVDHATRKFRTKKNDSVKSSEGSNNEKEYQTCKSPRRKISHLEKKPLALQPKQTDEKQNESLVNHGSQTGTDQSNVVSKKQMYEKLLTPITNFKKITSDKCSGNKNENDNFSSKVESNSVKLNGLGENRRRSEEKSFKPDSIKNKANNNGVSTFDEDYRNYKAQMDACRACFANVYTPIKPINVQENWKRLKCIEEKLEARNLSREQSQAKSGELSKSQSTTYAGTDRSRKYLTNFPKAESFKVYQSLAKGDEKNKSADEKIVMKSISDATVDTECKALDTSSVEQGKQSVAQSQQKPIVKVIQLNFDATKGKEFSGENRKHKNSKPQTITKIDEKTKTKDVAVCHDIEHKIQRSEKRFVPLTEQGLVQAEQNQLLAGQQIGATEALKNQFEQVIETTKTGEEPENVIPVKPVKPIIPIPAMDYQAIKAKWMEFCQPSASIAKAGFRPIPKSKESSAANGNKTDLLNKIMTLALKQRQIAEEEPKYKTVVPVYPELSGNVSVLIKEFDANAQRVIYQRNQLHSTPKIGIADRDDEVGTRKISEASRKYVPLDSDNMASTLYDYGIQEPVINPRKPPLLDLIKNSKNPKSDKHSDTMRQFVKQQRANVAKNPSMTSLPNAVHPKFSRTQPYSSNSQTLASPSVPLCRNRSSEAVAKPFDSTRLVEFMAKSRKYISKLSHVKRAVYRVPVKQCKYRPSTIIRHDDVYLKYDTKNGYKQIVDILREVNEQ